MHPLRFSLLALAISLLLFSSTLSAQTPAIEQWSTFELTLKGPSTGNPFIDTQLAATFSNSTTTKTIPGFYDGDGTYRIRFMPTSLGPWHYQTTSNAPSLNAIIGDLTCEKPSPSNHGPVSVHNTFHFAYADGSPYIELGTTCYAWTQEPDPQEQLTLDTLKSSPFNKLRMCVLPLRYPSPRQLYPFAGTGPNSWDFDRFNVEFFQHLDQRIQNLRDLNIEADIILFHPYDTKTGFNAMNPEHDARYLKYLVARLSAYRNVWWSMANEFDLIRTKTDPDWDQIFKVVTQSDPYSHLASIHFSKRLYNYTLPWVTHASIQNGSAVQDFGRALLYRDVYNKPIVFDEVKYEGDIPQRWGHLSPQEMTDEFWHATIDGTYAGHSETFGGDGHNWLSVGGTLKGASPSRLAFLKNILASAPDIDPIDKWQNTHLGGKPGEYYLYYFGTEKPAQWTFELPRPGLKENAPFHIDLLDTWNMTITPIPTTFHIAFDPQNKYTAHDSQNQSITLPQKPYLALRILPN